MTDFRRCHDCLNEISSSARVFVVLKRLRDLPMVDGQPVEIDPAEAGMIDALLHDQVAVCADCVGWYGDDAIEVTDV